MTTTTTSQSGFALAMDHHFTRFESASDASAALTLFLQAANDTTKGHESSPLFSPSSRLNWSIRVEELGAYFAVRLDGQMPGHRPVMLGRVEVLGR